jgi:hypothetical protein
VKGISHKQIKRRKKLQVLLKNMHYFINPQEIKTETENLGHMVTNIWNIKHSRTKLPLPTFSIDLKPVPNKKDIFNVEYIQQCKIKFELPKQKRDISQCANCQIWAYQKLLPS